MSGMKRESGPSAFCKRLIAVGLLALLLIGSTACAPRPSAEQEPSGVAEGETPSVDVSWSIEADCSACHERAASSKEDASCLYGAYHADIDCLACHSEESSLAEAHENMADADEPKKLKKTAVEDSSCTSCHTSSDELAAETAESIALVDEKGTKVNPHDLPADVPEHESVACASCHAMHEEADASAQAAKTCASCHHAGVYECGTCHSV